MSRVSDTVHAWLGLCPDHRAVRERRRTGSPRLYSLASESPMRWVHGDTIVRYGVRGISLPFFIGAMIVCIGATAFLLLVLRFPVFPVPSFIVNGLILLAAGISFLSLIEKASLGISNNIIIIQRSFHREIAIPKASIATMAIKENKPSLPLWFQMLLVFFLIPASSAGIVYGRYLQVISGEILFSSFLSHLSYSVSVIVFFLIIYYGSRRLSYYPSALIITTTTGKVAGIYHNNPKEIADLVETPA